MYNFNNVEEEVKTTINTPVDKSNWVLGNGIHEVTITTEYAEGKTQNGEAFEAMDITFSNENGKFKKRFFATTDQDRTSKDMKRLLHLYGAVVDKILIQAQNFTSFKDMVDFFATLNGNRLRIKLIPSYKNKIYSDTPSYFSGWAENISVTETKLAFSNAEKASIEEATALREASKKMKEANTTTPSLVASSSDDLPF